jgi:hypothetical protein
MRVSLPRLSVVHLRRRRSVLAVLAGVAVLLELAAGVGLAYVAGWSQVRAVLGDFDGIWMIALVGALLVSFVGYHYAYRGIFRVEGGPTTIWVSGAPLAVAVAGVFVYRVLALLLPMPVSLAVLPTLRQMAARPASHAGGTGGVKEPALQPAAGNQRTTDSS